MKIHANRIYRFSPEFFHEGLDGIIKLPLNSLVLFSEFFSGDNVSSTISKSGRERSNGRALISHWVGFSARPL